MIIGKASKSLAKLEENCRKEMLLIIRTTPLKRAEREFV